MGDQSTLNPKGINLNSNQKGSTSI